MFFLYYPMILVHDRHTPTPDTIPQSEYDNFDLYQDFPNGARAGDRRKYFPDMLAYMDKLVGNVVKKLTEHGLREKTLVIVMGDNCAKECFRFSFAHTPFFKRYAPHADSPKGRFFDLRDDRDGKQIW
jgi:arylsulfatase A